MKISVTAFLNILYLTAFIITGFFFSKIGWNRYIVYLAVAIVLVRVVVLRLLKK